MTSNQPDPFNTLAQGAISMHEMYQSFVEAGFTADQALILVVEVLKASVMANHQPPK